LDALRAGKGAELECGKRNASRAERKAGLFATNSAAMIEFAPGLLSMTTGWPQLSCIFAPTMRAMMSLPPPGGKPTTMWMGFEGYWAKALAAAHKHESAKTLAFFFMALPQFWV